MLTRGLAGISIAIDEMLAIGTANDVVVERNQNSFIQLTLYVIIEEAFEFGTVE
jgi:hypothetical protein